MVRKSGVEPLKSLPSQNSRFADLRTCALLNLESGGGIEPPHISICNRTPYRLGYPLMVGVNGVEPILSRI